LPETGLVLVSAIEIRASISMKMCRAKSGRYDYRVPG
jgi:hypothetical protein